MGLDMYLYKKVFVGANFKHREIKGKIELTEGKENKPIKIQLNRVSEIVEQVGYWRKANAIHKWFVENIQHGEDNCAEYYIGVEGLKKLLEDCNKVLEGTKLVKGKIKNGRTFKDGEWKDDFEDGEYIEDPSVAVEVLPCAEGFFFGSSEYDQYYLEDIKYTKNLCEECIKEDGNYYYSSSW
jgi:hypothetical protein